MIELHPPLKEFIFPFQILGNFMLGGVHTFLVQLSSNNFILFFYALLQLVYLKRIWYILGLVDEVAVLVTN